MIIIPRTDRSALISLLRKLLLEYLIPNTNRNARDQVIQHLEAINQDPKTMLLGLRFDSSSRPDVTQIVIEIGFGK